MSLHTGGRAIGATSTRSRSASAARSRALPIGTMPTCSPSGPTRRTSGTRIRSLILGSELMGPPQVRTVAGTSRECEGPVPRVRPGPRIPTSPGRTAATRTQRRTAGPRTGPGTLRVAGWGARGFRLAHPRGYGSWSHDKDISVYDLPPKPAAGTGAARVGISGWTYPPWRGVFYPKGLAHRRELEYVASKL